jgi:predicted phosphodiesterase
MRMQLLSDLHLETETFVPQPAPGAELLVLAGDIDATWARLDLFANWPVPVLMVAGNHEFDGRELSEAWPALRARCAELGIRLLERERFIVTSAAGRRVRFVGTVRWSDFDGLGAARREHAQGRWDDTVVVTHFAPSLRSADPRFGKQPGTASFCNADDDLLPLADLWLHGHLHCRHDYTQDRAGRRPTRVVCQAMGLIGKGEAEGFDPLRLIELPALT